MTDSLSYRGVDLSYFSGERYGIGAHDMDFEPQDPAEAWERMKAFYDAWYGKHGDETDNMWRYDDEVLHATDLAFLLAVAAGKPEEKAQAIELLANAVDGWRLANARQKAIITRLQRELSNAESEMEILREGLVRRPV